MNTTLSPDDCGAFLPYPTSPKRKAATGPLAGLTLGVKDLFDVAGYPTGCGHPLKLEQSEIATVSAPPVQALLDAGIEFVGKTHLDELAYSTNGINAHYGAPSNASVPDRVTGGSSSGSASAVCGKLADVALGSDTGGSVRVPASYCGLFGIRPTHGAISLEGAMPLAPSFDTVGWFTRDARLLTQVGDLLLPPTEGARVLKRIVIAEDAFDRLPKNLRGAFGPTLKNVRDNYSDVRTAEIFPDGISDRRPVFRTAQGYEAWQSHGAWLTRYMPDIGPGVSGRFRYGSTIDRETYDETKRCRAAVRSYIDDLVGADAVILLPTTLNPAPLRNSDNAELESIRNDMQQVLCITSLTGHPQISIPGITVDGAPIGLSIIGPRGSDRSLLRRAEDLATFV
jgi:amidase